MAWEKPAFTALWDNGHREIRIYASGKVELFEDGSIIPTLTTFVITNRIPQLLAEAREQGRSEK